MYMVFLLALTAALTGFSIHEKENQLGGQGDFDRIDLNRNNSSKIPHDIPESLINQFIEYIKPGEMLLSKSREADLNTSSLFNDFLVVCYQSGRYQDAYYFVPEKMAKDAEKALYKYSETDRKFYAQLIPIKDTSKFWKLAAKTSVGCAQKDGDWRDCVKWFKSLNEPFAKGYTMLDKTKLAYAMAAPNQQTDLRNGSWSCGPNSGFRVLRLLSELNYDFDSFIDGFPRAISREATIDNGTVAAGVGIGLTFLGMIFAPFTAGLSLIPGVATYAVGAGTAATGMVIPSDVGPNPKDLASYLTSTMKNHRAQFSGYSSQIDYEKSIATDIRTAIYPRIILIVSGTFSMHYLTVVGVRLSADWTILEAIVLDTNGALGAISNSQLRHWLDRDGYANLILDARYNTIEFFSK